MKCDFCKGEISIEYWRDETLDKNFCCNEHAIQYCFRHGVAVYAVLMEVN